MERHSERIRMLFNLLHYLPQRKFFLVLSSLILAIEIIATVLFAWLLRVAMDSLLAGAKLAFVRAVFCDILLGIAMALLRGYWKYFRETSAGIIATNLRERLSRKLLEMPLSDYEQLSPGEIGSRLTSDIDKACPVVGHLYLFLRTFFLASTSLLYMIRLDLSLAVASAVFSPLLVFAGRHFSDKISQLAVAAQDKYAKMTAFYEDSSSKSWTANLLGIQQSLGNTFIRLSKEVEISRKKLADRVILLSTIIWGISLLSVLVIFGYGGYRVFQGGLSLGVLFAIMQLSNNTRNALGTLGEEWSNIMKCLGSSRKVMEILHGVPDLETKTPDLEKCSVNTRGLHRLRLQNISYSHVGQGKPTLFGITIEIPCGTTFIVGPNGAGKSTLLKVLAGLYRPQSGTIYLDGCEESVVYVPQEPYVLGLTIEENIKMGNPNVCDEHVRKSLDVACANFVYALPSALKTVIAPGTGSLSAGQLARICIARALLVNPKILLLDEPGANLDARTEQELLSKLRKEYSNKYLVIVTHHLSSILDHDYVVVLNEGQVVQCGTHGELVGVDGIYRYLFYETLRGYNPQ